MRARSLHPLIFAALVLGGCGEQPRAEAESEPAAELAAPSAAALLEIEKKSWTDWAAKDEAALGAFMASGFVDVSRAGAFDRAATLRRWTTHDCEMGDVTFSDERVEPIADGVALLTFTTSGGIICGGVPAPSPTYSSTLYVRDGDTWRSVYYQEATSAEATGEPTPLGSSDGSLAASGNTAPDDASVVLETALWETWKNRDRAAFETLIARRFVGNGPWGRVDRNAMLDMAFDAACAVESYALGPMTKVQVTDDVVLITYRAEQAGACDGDPLDSPVMAAGLHVREGGRWLAAYYMETPMR